MRSLHGFARFAVILPCVAACGGGGGRARPALPDAPILRAYPALAYVPAEPDAVVVVQHAGDVVVAVRAAVEAGARVLDGMFGDDSTDIGRDLEANFGFDALDGAALAEHGLVLDGSAVVYVQGTGATAVLPVRGDSDLADALAAGLGDASQSEVVDGINVETMTSGPARLSWASADGWLWLHAELGRGGDAAWFTSSRAALGAIAGDADLAWATTTAGARLRGGGATPPVAGFARMDRLLDGPAGLMLGFMGKRCVTTVGQAQRVAVAGNLAGDTPEIVALADIDDTAAVRGKLNAEPQGWAQVGAAPALVAAVNVDLYAAAELAGTCIGADAPTIITEVGVHTGRAFVEDFNIAGFKGSVGGAVETEHDGTTRGLIDMIPARSMLETKTTFGAIEGYSLNLPLVGKLAFAISPTRFMIGKGSGYDLAKLAGTPTTTVGNLLHVTLRPNQLSADTWSFVLGSAGLARREASATQAALREWDLIDVALDSTDAELVLSLRGTPAAP